MREEEKQDKEEVMAFCQNLTCLTVLEINGKVTKPIKNRLLITSTCDDFFFNQKRKFPKVSCPYRSCANKNRGHAEFKGLFEK